MPEKKEAHKDRICERCGTHAAVFQRFGLHLCRRCFREMASKMGFEKHE